MQNTISSISEDFRVYPLALGNLGIKSQKFKEWN